MKLAGAHAVVTGGGTGIGAATARALAAEGTRLTLIGRRREPLEQVAGELPQAQAVSADVTDGQAVQDALAAARRRFGPVAILINNAGAAPSKPFARTTTNDWRAVFAVNVDAAFQVTQAALPDLQTARAGRVINVASTAGLKGYSYTSAYVAAKHALIGLTRALATEFARTSLTVNAVCPGFTDTPLVDAAAANIAEKTGGDGRVALARFNPQGRLVAPEEVAAAILWLALPENRSVTGQALVVAGGEVM